MTSKLAYECYNHTIRASYASLGLAADISAAGLKLFEYSALASLSKEAMLDFCVSRIRSRLGMVSGALLTEFLDQPKIRSVFFQNREILIPILNKQAIEWYGSSSIFNFDFMIESFLGMHANARTIYDIGGHQGIWAAYYSIICGDQGRVYTFEPSIINIECSSLLFLINSLENIVNIPFGIGDQTGIINKQESGVLIDFVEHNIGLLRFDNIFWERADFIKIDIEGFEYEFLKSFNKLFDFCPNVHLELHIPHLINRGLDYKEVYELIPFDRVNILNYQNGQLTSIGKTDELSGFCSLLITAK